MFGWNLLTFCVFQSIPHSSGVLIEKLFPCIRFQTLLLFLGESIEIRCAHSLNKSRSSLTLSLLDLEIFSPKFPVLQTASDICHYQGPLVSFDPCSASNPVLQNKQTNKQTKINALPFEDLKTRIILHNLPLGNLHLLPLWTSPIVKTAANNSPPLCLSFWHILTCQSINYPLPSSSSLASFFTTYILLLCLEKSSLFFS